MRYVLNGFLKEYRNKRCTDKMRTKLTETTLITSCILTETVSRDSKQIKLQAT